MGKNSINTVFFWLFLQGGFAFAENSHDKVHDDSIRQLVVVMQAPVIALNGAKKSIQSRKEDPKNKKMFKFYDCLDGELNIDVFVNMLIPIYKKYYSYEDAVEGIKFFKTDAGKIVRRFNVGEITEQTMRTKLKEVSPDLLASSKKLAFLDPAISMNIIYETKIAGGSLGASLGEKCKTHIEK